MKYKYFVTFFCILNWVCTTSIQSQSITWYYPWENSIRNLEIVASDEVIPLQINGTAYRIVKLLNNSNNLINIFNFSSKSPGVSLEVFFLPVIQNFSNQPILDVMLPLTGSKVVIKKGEASYFLVKFKGITAGEFNVPLSLIESNGETFTTSKKLYVGNRAKSIMPNMNVWAYFNYPLINGLQNQVVNDLVSHHSNVLIIPPNVLPSITAANVPNTAPKLNEFLKGKAGKFDYYLIYSNYKEYDDSFILSAKWKRNFLTWYQVVKESLTSNGIDNSKVYFYPYDEPSVRQSRIMINLINWCKSNGINIKYYVTIGNNSVIDLAQHADIVQLYNRPENLNAYNKIQEKKSKLWIYEIVSEARNRAALKYLMLGWTAFKYDAIGIGTWNYADIRNAYTSKSIQNFKLINKSSSNGSWTFHPTNYKRDYSLVYRKGDNLYSSLRWEALSQSLQDYQYLQLYGVKKGKTEAKAFVDKMLDGEISMEQWDVIKLGLLGK